MTGTRAHRVDRRVRRTQRLLREALVSLTVERGWDAVTVSDVCERADVGRSTFYIHFADKENLLLSGFDELLTELKRHGLHANHPFAFAEPLLSHAADNVRLFRAITGRQSAQQVQWRFRDLVVTLIDDELAPARRMTAWRRRTLTEFLAGGFVALMMHWLDDAKPCPPEEQAQVFRELALSVVRGEVPA